MSRITADLAWVAAYWPDLVEARLPGTARPWRQPDLSPERRAERDHAARAEKLERSDLAWGETPAPVDVAVLDLLGEICWHADDIAGLVADAIGCPRLAPPSTALADAIGCPRLAPPSTALADARPWLDFAARHASAAALDVEVYAEAARTARHMVDQVARALCLVYDGQRLDVVCPWCRGGLTGAKTWRVRELPGDLVAIVCESELCEPPGRDVGTWWRGRPCWPVAEWDWLAKQVTAAEARVPDPA